ncbi:MAG: signal peptidase II [Candidatus Moraniibacteriota bacterium]|nr:MAG: signal peptidase II [Candidatus Moranbacteria bacterium]
MLFWRKEIPLGSLFVFTTFLDVWLRFFFLERDQWTCNEGAFWGLALPSAWLWSLAGLFLLILGYVASSTRYRGERLFFVAILLGGGVNMIDRLFFGCVLDYFSWPWILGTVLPNFNLADMLILLGFFGLGWKNLSHHNEYASKSIFRGDDRTGGSLGGN